MGFSAGAVWGLEKGAPGAALEEYKLTVGLVGSAELELQPEFTEVSLKNLMIPQAFEKVRIQGFLS